MSNNHGNQLETHVRAHVRAQVAQRWLDERADVASSVLEALEKLQSEHADNAALVALREQLLRSM